MIRNLDTDQLRAFVTVADYQTFTAAAEVLGRTQAAVSQQIKKLETVLDKRLFSREARRVDLTDDGLRLIGPARKILALNDETVSRFLSPEITGTVRIGTPDDYATQFLPHALGAFAQTYPDVRVEVECEESVKLMPMLERGAIDLALTTKGKFTQGGEWIRTEELAWVTSAFHETHKRDPLPLAMFPDGCIFRTHAANGLEAVGRDWHIAYASRSVSAIHAAVMSGCAVSVLSRSTVPAQFRILTEADGFPQLPNIDIMLQVGGNPSAAAEELAQHLKRIMSTIGPRPLPTADAQSVVYSRVKPEAPAYSEARMPLMNS